MRLIWPNQVLQYCVVQVFAPLGLSERNSSATGCSANSGVSADVLLLRSDAPISYRLCARFLSSFLTPSLHDATPARLHSDPPPTPRSLAVKNSVVAARRQTPHYVPVRIHRGGQRSGSNLPTPNAANRSSIKTFPEQDPHSPLKRDPLSNAK
ncbi:hypothetical protein DPEC_G00308900 [Dallia pectoralis]|uniref:Uncharacterized protein n=1 Tax=Dallia pectoralis TaxID=75939 RepID=A0ACC2FET7_DALPE|nr:hypothetical protein DPEC_G00308900 [Dallia pectoralis]